MALLFNISHQKSVAIPVNLICNQISNTSEWFSFPCVGSATLQHVERQKSHVLHTLS